MRNVILGALLVAATFAGAAHAQAYKSGNRLVVTPVGNGSFSVPSAGKFGANGAWCAAGSYAKNVLGAPGANRLYVQQPKTTNSGPVVFGLDPAGATPVAVVGTTAALRTAGSNLSINHARQFCRDRQRFTKD